MAAIVCRPDNTIREVCLTHLAISDHDIWDWLWLNSGGDQDSVYPFAVLEKVSSRPAQGVASTFAFGMSYGACRMALAAAAIPYEEVTPSKWQKEMGIANKGNGESRTQFKGRLRARAQLLFPREQITLATADALLLAEYARRKSRQERK